MTQPTHSASDQDQSDSATASHHDLLEQCRLQRREMLQQWDTATEELISDYETRVVAVRLGVKNRRSTFKKQLAESLQQLQETADIQRMEIMQRFEETKSQPIVSDQNNEQVVQKTNQKVQAAIKNPLDWLNNQSISLPKSLEPQEACLELGITSPSSVPEAIQALNQLSRLGDQVNQQIPAGITPTLVGGFLLPLIGGLVGLVTATSVWLIAPEPSILTALIAGILPTALGMLGHFILKGPIEQKANQLAPQIASIRDAAEHCVLQARELSSTLLDAETKQLAFTRDHELAQVDQWLSNQQEGLEARRLELVEQSKDHMLEELQDLDTQFSPAMTEMESQMRSKADKLAQQINQVLESKS